MSIVAAFDKTLFFNEASRYAVLRLKTADLMIPEAARDTYKYSDHLIRFVAVGYDLPQTDSIKVELDGEWTDGKHGLQFQVEQWREIVPPTLEGIRGYLSSGLLKGIGPRTAEAIVNRFGVDSLQVIEHEPERLLEIRGITPDRLDEIKMGYAESKVMRELLLLLAPFKVTPATAMKIYEYFGPGGVELLRQSPFRLCQVPGFGFKRVDAIVQKSGGDMHDPMRIEGALFYALEQSRSEGGHLYLESDALVKKALQLLNEKIPQAPMHLTGQQVVNVLERMILTDVVVSSKGNIYLPHVFKQESESACKAVEMLMEVPEPVNIGPAIEEVKRTLGMKLSQRQIEGVEMVFHSNLSIITGGPGTGKSTVLKAIIEVYRILYPKKIIKLAAPTGKASRRMAETTGISDAQTLHSLLGLRGEDGGWQKKPQPLEADMVIVDESSMMDMWLAYQMFLRLKTGTKLLLVGDVDQLESVGAGNVFHELIDCGLVPVTVLDEIFRQAKDSPIPHNAKAINKGISELHYGDDFAFINAGTQEEVAEMIRSLFRREAAQVGIGQVQVLSPFRSRGDASSDAMNETIRADVNPASPRRPEITFGGKVFRLRDKVMQIKNNCFIHLFDEKGDQVSSGVFNGEIGRVSLVEPGKLQVEYDGRLADYPAEALGELELAYATTIHKAMGSEYDTVIIPMLSAHRILLTRNLLYTAVTRAKRRVILVGQKKALFMAIHTSRKGKRNTLLGERMKLYHHALSLKKAPVSTEEIPPLKKAS